MATDDTLRTTAITELQSILVETQGVEDFLERVTVRMARHVAPATHASITLRRPGDVRTVASSDARAAVCDTVEYEAGSGPCLAAIHDQQTYVVPDVTAETRWPEWAAAARAAGFMSGAAVPVEVRPGVAMALNLYSERKDAWSGASLNRATVLAHEVARTLTISLRATEQAEINADLRAALASRATIDQAMGVIMAENRCSAEEAFQILRSASQHRNVKLRDVAAAVIEGITGFAPGTPKEFREGRD